MSEQSALPDFVYYTNSRRSLSCTQIQEHSLVRIQDAMYETDTKPVRQLDKSGTEIAWLSILAIR